MSNSALGAAIGVPVAVVLCAALVVLWVAVRRTQRRVPGTSAAAAAWDALCCCCGGGRGDPATRGKAADDGSGRGDEHKMAPDQEAGSRDAPASPPLSPAPAPSSARRAGSRLARTLFGHGAADAAGAQRTGSSADEVAFSGLTVVVAQTPDAARGSAAVASPTPAAGASGGMTRAAALWLRATAATAGEGEGGGAGGAGTRGASLWLRARQAAGAAEEPPRARLAAALQRARAAAQGRAGHQPPAGEAPAESAAEDVRLASMSPAQQPQWQHTSALFSQQQQGAPLATERRLDFSGAGNEPTPAAPYLLSPAGKAGSVPYAAFTNPFFRRAAGQQAAAAGTPLTAADATAAANTATAAADVAAEAATALARLYEQRRASAPPSDSRAIETLSPAARRVRERFVTGLASRRASGSGSGAREGPTRDDLHKSLAEMDERVAAAAAAMASSAPPLPQGQGGTPAAATRGDSLLAIAEEESEDGRRRGDALLAVAAQSEALPRQPPPPPPLHLPRAPPRPPAAPPAASLTPGGRRARSGQRPPPPEAGPPPPPPPQA